MTAICTGNHHTICISISLICENINQPQGCIRVPYAHFLIHIFIWVFVLKSQNEASFILIFQSWNTMCIIMSTTEYLESKLWFFTELCEICSQLLCNWKRENCVEILNKLTYLPPNVCLYDLRRQFVCNLPEAEKNISKSLHVFPQGGSCTLHMDKLWQLSQSLLAWGSHNDY